MVKAVFSQKLRLAKGVVFAMTLLFYAHGTEGLRGCSSFGHSCFGAHGKRTDSDDKEVVLQPARVGGAAVGGGDMDYPVNPRFDVNMAAADFRGFGAAEGTNLPPSRGRIPLALLKLLRNLAINREEQSSGSQKKK